MINGILNIYKEKGYTSHDVVARLRKITGQKKIGHTGTLDPDAEGVLPVCLGRATKVCDMLTDRDKTYRAVLLLGKTTDTQDISGKVLSEKDTEGISTETVLECVRGFVGEYDQIPPMYSALKINGRKLYELAREGKTVERKSRRVMIREINIEKTELPRVYMEVSCSKGTYIRTLCHDIGERLGTGGCMEQLVRTRAGSFDISGSHRIEEVAEAAADGRIEEYLIPLDSVFEGMRKITVKDRYASKAYNGNPLPARAAEERADFRSGGQYRVYDVQGHFIGVYRYSAGAERFTLEKMFLDPEELSAGSGGLKG
ncbi:MAG TPA: tRNA pseudouridine(55) synthase TruB [Candidatus Mediterraneibacter stercoravium]|uniref:tRNA pseudouridine synthase B n=1 Tax=Candidatus Mediterraneibacter stercoravium TaxID=2838685 RepID=A0A9D2K1H1_9FIRM|nr:tRNA pseudouridine(55) synthase TruB [Candidatus Mediterraneibacter stercoravium]